MTAAALLLGAALLSTPESVVVFPLEPRGLSPEAAEAATRALVEALEETPGLRVIGPAAARRRDGVDLGLQAQGCSFDVFCLVEVARLLAGEVALVGAVEVREGEGPAAWILALRELDVARATLTETVRHAVPAEDLPGLRAAARGAGRRLVTEPSARLALEISPESARIDLFGEPLEPGRAVRPWWPGAWRYRVRALGYEPRRGTIELREGATATLALELRPDPLFVGPDAPPPAAAEPFARPSRSAGSGVGIEDAGIRRDREARPGRFARPAPWVAVALGALALGAGTGLVLDARSSYASLAEEPRYTGGGSLPADLAAGERGSLRDRHLAGSIVGLSGVLAVVGGLGWMLLVDPEPEP